MTAHIRNNAVAYLALFVALSGTAYAATALPRNSVGTKQIKKRAVTAKKVKVNALGGGVINEAKLGKVPSAVQADTAGDAATVGGKAAGAFLESGAKAVDADKLDGIDSAVFGTVQTYAGMNFEPRDTTATDKAYQGTGTISCTGTPVDFAHRLQLPQGALITKVDYRYVDNSAGANNGFEIRAYDQFEIGGFVTVLVASVSEAADEGGRRTISTTLATPHAVDNAHYSYELLWSPTICDPESQLAGAAVHYTMPN